jgi:hypothetical protein
LIVVARAAGIDDVYFIDLWLPLIADTLLNSPDDSFPYFQG